jgi:7-keto-8-aminopelargonate synthetase-like enzyme
MESIEQYLQTKLEQRKAEGNFRSLKVLPNAIDFTSNDYLGMSRNPLFAKKWSVNVLCNNSTKWVQQALVY